MKSNKSIHRDSIDIIIVNYNSSSHLEKCIESIKASADSFPITFYVVDNHSSDDIHRVVTLYPEANFSLNKKNLGFAAAVNQALRQGSAPYVVLINPDAHVTPGFFESVVSYMNSNTDVGIVGPKILNSDGSVQGSARSFPNTLTGLFGRTSLLTRLFPNNRISRANILTHSRHVKFPVKVDWVSGACMIVRRPAIAEIGGMDERFFMYWEDADWCTRMRKKNWKVIYYPMVSVIHHVGVSSNHRKLGSIFEFHKSVYRLYEKYTDSRLFMLKPFVFAALCVRFMIIAFFQYVKTLYSR